MPTCTPLSTTTPHYGLCMPLDGEGNWGTAFRTNMSAIDTAVFNASFPRSYLSGMGLTNNGTTKIDIASGVCKGNDQATALSLSSTLTKDLNAAWAVGNNSGGLFTGTIAANTWYHVFAILRTDTNVVDVGFDTSITAANIPSPYTIYRRLGSVLTTAGSIITPFVQYGDTFEWTTVLQDYSAAPGVTTAVLRTLSVPPGLSVRAWVSLLFTNGTSANDSIYLSDPATTDSAPDRTTIFSIAAGAINSWVASDFYVFTNTSRQIRTRMEVAGGADIMRISTKGWIDRRGQDA